MILLFVGYTEDIKEPSTESPPKPWDHKEMQEVGLVRERLGVMTTSRLGVKDPANQVSSAGASPLVLLIIFNPTYYFCKPGFQITALSVHHLELNRTWS